MHPSKIPDDRFCVGMDIAQLLYLMKWIFGKPELDYSFEEKRTQIIPRGDWSTEYEAMVVCDREALRKGRIIKIGLEEEREFGIEDYLNIDNEPYMYSNAKMSLYFLIVVTKWFNGKHRIDARGDVTCYYLLNNQGGKELIYYLLYMILGLLLAYTREDMEKADNIVSALNRDLASIEQLYSNVGEILEEIGERDEDIRERCIYPNAFFVNQSDLLRDWIKDHYKIMEKSDIWEFIFADSSSSANVFLKNFAVKLIYHIEKIDAFFRQENRDEFRWFSGMKAEPVCHDFYHLDNLIQKLEEGDKSILDDKKKWAVEYLKRLLQLIQEIERIGSGLQLDIL